MKIITNRNLTFKQLIKEIDKLYPDGVVEDFTLKSCYINRIPNIDGIIYSSKRGILKKVFTFEILGFTFSIKKRGKNRDLLFGKYKNTKRISFLYNVFSSVKSCKKPPFIF